MTTVNFEDGLSFHGEKSDAPQASSALKPKVCFLNYATDDGRYGPACDRLMKSFNDVPQQGSEYDRVPLLTFRGDYALKHSLCCPKHTDPCGMYAFKPAMMRWARDKGYTHAIWLDASIVCVADPQPLVDWVVKRGNLLIECPARMRDWTSNKCCDFMRVQRQSLDLMTMVWTGCFGLKLSDPFLNMWWKYSKMGTFDGPHSGPEGVAHRHDQTVASILAFQAGWTNRGPVLLKEHAANPDLYSLLPPHSFCPYKEVEQKDRPEAYPACFVAVGA